MKNPKRTLPLSGNERTIEILSLLLLVFMWVYAAWQFGSLPETVPNHFNAKGIADGWGGKSSIFIGPGVALFTYLLMYFVGKMSPDTYNYPFKITEENKEYQYTLARLILKITNFLCMLLMAFITWGIIQEAKGHSGAMNPIVFWGLIIGLFLIIGWYFWLAKKAA